MARSEKALITFTAGEWSGKKDARIDLEKAPAALRLCRNMIVDRYGGVFRRPGLKYISTVKEFGDISYVSYEGSGTLYGITEFGDLSDPPRKYRNLYPSSSVAVRWCPGGSWNYLLASAESRVNYNDAGTKTSQLGLGNRTGGAGSDVTFSYGPPPSGWTPPEWIGNYTSGGSSGGVAGDTFEDRTPGTAPPDYSNANFFGTWVRGKRKKYYKFSTISRVTGEDVNSPGWLWLTQSIGSTTSSIGRFNAKIYAVASGTGFWTVYLHWAMNNPAIGTGPSSYMFLKTAPGDQEIDCSSGGIRICGDPGAYFFPRYIWGRFSVPENTSIRFRGEVGGETPQQFPPDLSSLSYPTTDEDAAAGGFPRHIYLPAVSAGVEADDEYAEFLTLEDAPEDFLTQSGASGVTVGTESWAQTSVFSGGITAESHDPITYSMRTVQSTYALTGLISGYTYPVTLTYSQRDIGGGGETTVQEIEDIVATGATMLVTKTVKAPSGKERKLTNASKGVGVAPSAPVTTLEAATVLWKGEVSLNGGTYNQTDVDALDALHVALATIDGGSLANCKYIMPLCGRDFAAAATPSFDYQRFGNPTNFNGNLGDSDFDPARGLIGESWVSDATAKMILMPFKLNQLGQSNKHGMHFNLTERPVTGLNFNPVGMWANPTSRAYYIAWNESLARWVFRAGESANAVSITSSSHSAGDTMSGVMASATSRILYKNGSVLGTNTNNDSTFDIGDYEPAIHGRYQPPLSNHGPLPTGYVSGIYIFDDGTFISDATKASALHSAIQTYLTALGRI